MEDPLGQLVIQRYLSDYHFPRVELAKFVVLYTRKYDIISCHIMSLKQRHGTCLGFKAEILVLRWRIIKTQCLRLVFVWLKYFFRP